MDVRKIPPPVLRAYYARIAREFLENQTLEEVMESTHHATQRAITLAGLALVRARRPEVQFFNELLILYPVPGQKRPQGVCPDNMVVLHDEPIHAVVSFDIPLQPVGPFWVLEYVSQESQVKDYENNLAIHENLKIPYYLVFNHEIEELILYRRGRRGYRAVPPNEQDRYPITELDLELGLLNGWVRFWYQGQLLPLPEELQSSLDQTRAQLAETSAKLISTEEKLSSTEEKLEEERQQRLALEAELARLRAQLGRNGQ